MIKRTSSNRFIVLRIGERIKKSWDSIKMIYKFTFDIDDFYFVKKGR